MEITIALPLTLRAISTPGEEVRLHNSTRVSVDMEALNSKRGPKGSQLFLTRGWRRWLVVLSIHLSSQWISSSTPSVVAAMENVVMVSMEI